MWILYRWFRFPVQTKHHSLATRISPRIGHSHVETSQKTVLVNSAADENGTIVEQAMARYDLLCRKYPSEFNNFIGRSSANPNNSNLFTIPRIINERPMIIAFPIAGGIVIIGLIVFFSLKKKKVI